jgi:hypothetical protein
MTTYKIIFYFLLLFTVTSAPAWAADDKLLDSVVCAPNPFSLSQDIYYGTIKYYLTDAAALDLEIYTPAGELVWSKSVPATDPDAQPNALRTIRWDGKNSKGQKVKFGGYLFKMVATPPHGGSKESATFKIGVLP